MTTSNPQVITVAHNQVVSLHDALEVVPIFTGDNIPFEQFIEGCREAKDMLPAGTESNLTKLIKTKVNGDLNRLHPTQVYGDSKTLTILIEIDNFKMLRRIIQA